MAKRVKLICGDRSEYFSFLMAQNLLYINQEIDRVTPGGYKSWELPEDSPYEFINNGLIKRSDKRNSKKSAASARDTKGNKSSTETEIS